MSRFLLFNNVDDSRVYSYHPAIIDLYTEVDYGLITGNIGATNVLRAGNKFIGYLTLVFDVLKSIIPILYVKFNFTEYIYICSLIVFIGHVFPIWLKFKGGKGVATYLGILFCLN